MQLEENEKNKSFERLENLLVDINSLPAEDQEKVFAFVQGMMAVCRKKTA